MWRPYEDCLYNVAVTHSPRYLIDMKATESIFDRLQIPYDTLRKLENPFQPIKEHFRQETRKKGQDIWWADPKEEETVSLVVQHFSDLPSTQRNEIRAQSMVLFPSIFGSSQNKFKSVAAWLTAKYGVIMHNMRDGYTAGGRESITVKNKTYPNMPKIFFNLQEWVGVAVPFLQDLEKDELEHYWEEKLSENRLEQWISLIEKQAPKICQSFPLEEMVLEQTPK